MNVSGTYTKWVMEYKTGRCTHAIGLEQHSSTILSRHTLCHELNFSTNRDTTITGGQHTPSQHNTAVVLHETFAYSMVHGILQFTPSIAFRYVLHRCKSRDIRCRESFCIMCRDNTRRTPSPGPQESPFTVSISLAHKAPGPVIASNFRGLSGHSPSKKLAVEGYLHIAI
ncbi:hypothetical protein VNO78_37143 [Psophocarpus tetragonolobus]|uniref:Uncharacterized protein n=1 Tax=Psophocarpus tetragonolobus TaxID=3891 RepID=A0AAN9NJR8_PSOTE